MLGSRTFLMLGITLAAVAFGGWRMLLPGGGGGSNAVEDATSALITQTTRAFFTGADASLSAQHTATGSYAGTPLQPPLALVRADETSYCVQLTKGPLLQHEIGPGGTAQPGACPQ
jgi:hypothetical protein